MNSANINKLDSSGYTPLQNAIESNNLQELRTLLEYGADANIARNGTSPLNRAIHLQRSVAFIGLLIRYGAKVNAFDYRGYSPLWNAVEKKQLPVVECLLENAADANVTLEGVSVLDRAVSSGWPIEIIELLLHYGANSNAVGPSGCSVIYNAIEVDAGLAIVKRLLEFGADIQMERDGVNVLARAIQLNRSKEVIELLCTACDEQKECGCCSAELPKMQMVCCDKFENSHYFCATCIQKMADAQIGLMKYELKCFDTSNCSSKLLNTEKVLKPRTQKMLVRLEWNAEVLNSKDIENLASCPFCSGYKAIFPPVERARTLQCQNPECAEVSCRLCNQIDHPKQTCEQAKANRNQLPQHRIAEAMSEAIIRNCPGKNGNCTARIVKDDGCNKMTCSLPDCGASMCYECGEDITREKYDHFQNRSCKLYDENANLGADELRVERARIAMERRMRLENLETRDTVSQSPRP